MSGLTSCSSFSSGSSQNASGRRVAQRGQPCQHQRRQRHRQQCQAARQPSPLPPGCLHLRAAHQHEEEQHRDKVAEEQHDRRRYRRCDGRRRVRIAPAQPCRCRQHRHAAADLPVEKAQQEPGIVSDQRRGQRPQRAPPEQRPVQCRDAGQVQQQDTAQQHASGDVDRQQVQQQLGQDVAGEVGYDRPVRREHRPQYRVVRAGGEQHEARQVIGVVQYRRHLDDEQRRQQRCRGQQRCRPPCALPAHAAA